MSTSESTSDRAATLRLGCLVDRVMMSLNVKKMVRLCAKSESLAVLYPKSQSTVGGYLWIKADLQNLPLDLPIFISSVYAQILTRKYNLNQYQISFSLRFENFVFHHLLKIRTILAWPARLILTLNVVLPEKLLSEFRTSLKYINVSEAIVPGLEQQYLLYFHSRFICFLP